MVIGVGHLVSQVLMSPSLSHDWHGNTTFQSNNIHTLALKHASASSHGKNPGKLVAPNTQHGSLPRKMRSFQSPHGGAMVHMGKTGGSTISALLRNGCHSFVPHPCRTYIPHESKASQLITSYYHVPDFGLLPQSHHDFYFITVRDPFDRAISSFVFEHVLNRIARNETLPPIHRRKVKAAYPCFPTLEHFVSYLHGNASAYHYPYHQSQVVATSCVDLARAIFDGQVRAFHHLFFNYQRIHSLIPDVHQQVLYVTRQECLWDDWTSLNRALGQTNSVWIPSHHDQGQRRNLTTVHQPVTRTLSESSRSTLCRALQSEYDIYLWILRHARNLQAFDVEQSIAIVHKNCPEVRT
jgi:hypothetical protein